MTTNTSILTLRRVLIVDGATCAAMGALLVAASGPLGALMELPAALLFYAGLALVPIAAFMALVARGPRVHVGAAWLVILGNIAWVAASIVLLVSGWVAPNGLGTAFVLAQALAVAGLLTLEIGALRATPAAAGAA